MVDKESILQKLPAVDRVMQEPIIKRLQEELPRSIVLTSIRNTIESYRAYIADHRGDKELLSLELTPLLIAKEAAENARENAGNSLKPVINATGVIIHTNLGRVPLCKTALNALTDVASGYSNLELLLETGKRGSRQMHLESLICELTGAEAAFVLNNNAAAVYIALNTFAAGKEIIVSRGQLVEIGGSFRIPEIISTGGVKLVEIGTTNKTYLSDYRDAITGETAAFLKVHTSNYHMVGFTATVDTSDLSELAREFALLLIEDLGSGVLFDLSRYGLPPEPLVQDSISSGADLVTFSGDKLLGGPQAGVVVGNKDLVSLIRSNQLARILRVDKFTVAALEATLQLYLDEDMAISDIPVWQMLTAGKEELKKRAKKIARNLADVFGNSSISVVEGMSKVGGGALPTVELPTSLVAINVNKEHFNVEKYTKKLRTGNPPVILRLKQNTMLIDPRTITVEQDKCLPDLLKNAFK